MNDIQNMTIVDRVVERLQRQPLGDLITEEDLHDIVKQAIPKVFFAERIGQRKDSYSPQTTLPPLLIEIMSKLLRESAEQCVKTYLDENKEVVVEFWKKAMDAGFVNYFRKLEEASAQSHISSMLRPFLDDINKERMARGQMQIFF